VLLWDCPPFASTFGPYVDEMCVFHTLTVDDVVSSELWNGSYFQTAEKVKTARVATLMARAQSGRITLHLTLDFLTLTANSFRKVVQLQPHSVSWSNILDFMNPGEFHTLARAVSPTATHSGYSMNWWGRIYGASLIDYPHSALHIIGEAEKATEEGLRSLCGDRPIFLLPVQHNPLNITAAFLGKQCYPYWIDHYFQAARVLDARMLEQCHNCLSRISCVATCSWTYDEEEIIEEEEQQQQQVEEGTEENCALCLYPLTDPMSPCQVPQHQFCRTCLQELRSKGNGNACPQCR
jgi:hypothetical protein